MYRKFAIAAASLLTAAALAACGSSTDNTDDQPLDTESRVVTDTQSDAEKSSVSLTSEAVKELESIPGLDSDSIEAAGNESAGNTDNSAADKETTDSDSENSELSAEPMSFEVGGLTISAQEIPFDEKVKLSDDERADAALTGDTLYMLDGKKLREFTLGDKASETNTMALSGAYSRVDTDPYGTVYVSRDRFEGAVIDNSGEQTALDTVGEISLSKVADYGLCCSGGEITKFTDEETGGWSSVEEKELSFPDNVSAVEFAGDHVLIAHTTDSGCEVSVCDYDGNKLARTDGGAANEDITAVTEAFGVIAASSCGDLCLWNNAGELIGRLGSDDTAELLGADSPVMIKRLFAGDDGEIIAFCTDSNEDKPQARLFRITGF